MKPIVCVISFALGTSSPVLVSAQGPTQAQPKTGRGARDEAPTAQAQSNLPADVKLTQEIRRALVKDAAVSGSAKNVQVIAVDGKVTLRGLVNTAEEKVCVLEAAKKHANATHLADHLEVKANP